jgi:hypothetical protein
MNASDSPEQFSKIPTNPEEVFTVEIEAAKKLVRFEIENNIPLGHTFELVDEIIFPGELAETSDTFKNQIRINVSKLIKKATGSKIHSSNEERLSGLKKIEQDYKKP